MTWWRIVLMWQGAALNVAIVCALGWMWITRHEHDCPRCYVDLQKVNKRWLY